MKKNKLFLKIIFRRAAIFSAVFLATKTLAHDVWIEDTADQHLVIRFGEFGDELETSPGYLDSLSAPQAWTKTTVTNPVPFTVIKETNSFALGNSSATNFAAAETDFEVLSAKNKPSRHPIFDARWQPADGVAGTPTLTLDLVPGATPGEIHLYFRGKPMADETITAHGPDNFEKELKTDADGFVRFTLEKPGFYLFTCNHHRETVFGFSRGRSYDLISYNASLTLRLPSNHETLTNQTKLIQPQFKKSK